jgi:hypothetical protein
MIPSGTQQSRSVVTALGTPPNKERDEHMSSSGRRMTETDRFDPFATRPIGKSSTVRAVVYEDHFEKALPDFGRQRLQWQRPVASGFSAMA